MNIQHKIWSEKYRPITIDECVLPQRIKDQAKGLISSGNIPSLLFTGSAGIGKTTLAQAIAHEMGADFMKINASSEGNIDMLRTKLSQFASTVSFTDSRKITLLDEADGLSQTVQQALRGFMEEYSHNHTIIFTCNFSNKIIDAIKSRCNIFDFKITKEEKTELQLEFSKRVFKILDNEDVTYDKRIVAELVIKKFPDFRSVLNTLQGYAAGGNIDAGILLDMSDQVFASLITALKNNKFGDMRKWVAEHSDIDQTILYRTFYDKASELIQPKSIPELIMLLGEYSYKSSFVPDTEINTAAFLTSVMLSSIEWK